jgi:hypothetical protein
LFDLGRGARETSMFEVNEFMISWIGEVRPRLESCYFRVSQSFSPKAPDDESSCGLELVYCQTRPCAVPGSKLSSDK